MFNAACVPYIQPMYPHGIRSEADFQKTLLWERKRLERSGRSFIAVSVCNQGRTALRTQQLEALSSTLRETDWIGWIETGVRLGIIYTETGSLTADAATVEISKRLRSHLSTACPAESRQPLELTFETFLPVNAGSQTATSRTEACPEMEDILTW